MVECCYVTVLQQSGHDLDELNDGGVWVCYSVTAVRPKSAAEGSQPLLG